MERIMVNCAANLSRPGLILLSPFFCRWVLDWQENEGRRMSGGGVQSGRFLFFEREGRADKIGVRDRH